MSIIYPLNNFLNLNVKSVRRKLVNIQSQTTSMTAQQKIFDSKISYWEAFIDLPVLNKQQAKIIETSFLKLNGLVGTFYFSFPDSKENEGTASGIAIVDSFSNDKNSVLASGFSPNETVLKSGDFINFSNFELKMVLDDVVSDNEGKANINFTPKLRNPVSQGTQITCNQAKGIFRLSQKDNNIDINKFLHYSYSFSIREAF